MNTAEKTEEFNETLREKLLQCGFKRKREFNILLGDHLVFEINDGCNVTVDFDEGEENYLVIKKDHSLKHKEHYDLTFEQIKEIVLRHTGHELKEAREYSIESVVQRAYQANEAYYFTCNRMGVVDAAAVDAHGSSEWNYFQSSPTAKEAHLSHLFTQLRRVMHAVNADFPSKGTTSRRTVTSDLSFGYTLGDGVTACSPFQFVSDAAAAAFLAGNGKEYKKFISLLNAIL